MLAHAACPRDQFTEIRIQFRRAAGDVQRLDG
jgi:hypothetical protein